MSFALIALITPLATLGLGRGFLFAGPFILRQGGLDQPPSAAVLGRRVGAV